VVPATEADVAAVRAAVDRQARRVTPGIDDLEAYRSRQVLDPTHREATGPLHPASGASGLVVHRGQVLARWGRTTSVEMCFGLTTALLSAVAGLAVERQVLRDVREPVSRTVAHPAFAGPGSWEHLLRQTSGWDGELWGKPSSADAQGAPAPAGSPPGERWAYNDVRVNLLALALTLLWRRGLDDVARTELMHPLGASDTWSWHGLAGASMRVDGREVPVVSGSARWGGGLWACADDLARLGRLYLDGGRWHGHRILSPDWVEASWTPGPANPDYGYLWWLNDRGRVFPSAPRTGRAGRGDLGRHLLWVDPARDLVVVSHWGDGVDALLWEVSAALPAVGPGAP